MSNIHYSVTQDANDNFWYVLDDNGSTIDGPFSTETTAESAKDEHEWNDGLTVEGVDEGDYEDNDL